MTPAREGRPLRVFRSDESVPHTPPPTRGGWTRRLRQHLALVLALATSALPVASVAPPHALAGHSPTLLMAPQKQETPVEAVDAISTESGAPAEGEQAVPPEAEPPAEGDITAGVPETGTVDAVEPEDPVERVTPSSRGGPRPPSATTATEASEQPAGARVADIARKYLGFPYAWGGASPRTGFDCSGFDEYVYQESGISILPHDLWGQLNTGPRIALQDLQPGDLVFFQNTYKWGLSHGGVYLGNGQFIHSIEPGVGVQISSLDEGYWAARFMAGSRPWASYPPPGASSYDPVSLS